MIHRNDVMKQHQQRLNDTLHLSYIWIAYTDQVVMIERNKEKELPSFLQVIKEAPTKPRKNHEPAMTALRTLYKSVLNKEPEKSKVNFYIFEIYLFLFLYG